MKLPSLVFSGLLFAVSAIISPEIFADQIYAKFNEEFLSQKEIDAWIDQFQIEDQETARLLVGQIDFYSYKRVLTDLKELHQSKVILTLKSQGFISTVEDEYAFTKVDFSKTFSSKSGDLISYFYRTANKIRAAAFKNLGDLESNKEDKSDRALVLLDDYYSSGTQLLDFIGKSDYKLFSEYKKIFLVGLRANHRASKLFEDLKNLANQQKVAQQFIDTIHAKESDRSLIRERIKKFPANKIELVLSQFEAPFIEGNELLSDFQKTQLKKLLEKYSPEYMGGFASLGAHTVFFYSSPNGVPQIFWNTRIKLHSRFGKPWVPLFKRVEDMSHYYGADQIPAQNQVW
jgi:hypothetical protein